MAVLDVLNLNLGTEQNPNWVLHDLHDKRISTNAVTTATHLLATDASLSAINPITAANLASVLGVYKTISMESNTDLNTVIENGIYYSYTNVSHSPYGNTQVPFVMVVNKTMFQICQWFYDRNDQKMFYRFSAADGFGTSQDWKEVSVDIPSFYKNYNNIDALAEACFDVTPPDTVAATLKTAGTYSTGGDLIIVFTSGSHVFQILVQCSSNDIMWGVFARTLNTSTKEWWPWRPLSRRRTT